MLLFRTGYRNVINIRQEITMPTCTPVMGGRKLKDASPFMIAKPLFIDTNVKNKLLDGKCPKTPMMSKYYTTNKNDGVSFLQRYAKNVVKEESKVSSVENYQKDMEEKAEINMKPHLEFNNRNFPILTQKNKNVMHVSPLIKSNEKKEVKQFDLRSYLQQIDKNNASPFPTISDNHPVDPNALERLLGKKK